MKERKELKKRILRKLLCVVSIYIIAFILPGIILLIYGVRLKDVFILGFGVCLISINIISFFVIRYVAKVEAINLMNKLKELCEEI